MDTSELMLMNLCEAKANSIISVGTIINGKKDFKIYTNNLVDKSMKFEYEIGSITKVFTATLLARAVLEGKVCLEDTIDKFLKLPKGKYPTLLRVATHMAGYGNPFVPIINNTNPFANIDSKKLLNVVAKKQREDKDYPWKYSNLGIAVLGEVLKCIYGNYNLKIKALLEEYHMKDSRQGNGIGNMKGYWKWQDTDVFGAAGNIVSTIEDMLEFAAINLNKSSEDILLAHNPLKNIKFGMEKWNVIGNKIGLCWILDNKNGFIWHNGGTKNFNSYLGIDKKLNNAVVVLSNVTPYYKYNSTVIGAKKLLELKDKV